jgi:FG-GAP-like repeat
MSRLGGYVNGTQGVLQIALGNGDGTFRSGQRVDLPLIPRAVTTADFDNDGKLDIALASDKLYFYKGAGDGTFTARGSVALGTETQLQEARVGDFNGDGKTDLAVTGETNVYVMWNSGAFKFNTKTAATYLFTGDITPVDVNQDHYTDLLTTYYTCQQNGAPACPAWRVLFGGAGTQSLKPGYSFQSSQFRRFTWPTAADINGDGFNDVVALTPGNFVLVWLGKPNGAFQSAPLEYNTSSDATDALVASDLNRDGKIDLAVAIPGNMGMAVLLNATPQSGSCAAGKVSRLVTECRPPDNTYSTSPLHIVSRAFDAGHTVTSMQLYINNQLVAKRAGASLNYSRSVSDGAYFVVTKAWDNAGASFRTDRHINIYTGKPGETCATPANALHICLPTQNQTTSTSVHIFANSHSAVPITALQIYIDNKLIYNDTSHTTYVDVAFSVTQGSHDIVVKAFDANGKIFSESRNITAQ